MNTLPDLRVFITVVVILVTSAVLAGCTGYQQPQEAIVQTQAPTTPGGNVTVIMKNFSFDPSGVTVTHGTTVTWINQDSVDHQVTSDASGSVVEGAVFRSTNIATGGSFSFTFDVPGTYPYHCSIHPSMKGTITVT